MRTASSSSIGWVAIALATAAITGLVFIALFYALGMRAPFGTLNDICVAIGGILSGVLAWMNYPFHGSYAPRASKFALASGLIGACVVPIGSGLVVFDVTGWVLAGLVVTFGYALIGVWLLILNASALHWPAFPRRLAQFGIVAGAVMTLGLLAGPGILARTDSMDSAQWFVQAALFLGGLGWNMLFTVWCIGLGRHLLSKNTVAQGPETA